MPGISAMVLTSVLMLAGELGFDVELHGDGDVGFGEAVHASVALDGSNHYGHLDAALRFVGRCGPRVAPLSSKSVPPEPPPSLASRLGSMTAATFSSAKNWAILSRSL